MNMQARREAFPEPPAAAPAPPETKAALLNGEPKAPSLKLRWHESWIIRSAIIAVLILLAAYASSAFFAFESIEGVAKLAYDQDIEDALKAYQDSLKRVHSLEQELLLERLKPQLLAWQAAGAGEPRAATLKAWIAKQQLPSLGDPNEVRLTPLGGELGSPQWLERERLSLGSMLVEFPKGPTYEAFQAVSERRQRYQLVGVKLDADIRPTLMRATTTIFCLSFLLLMSLFLSYARRFRLRTGEVTDGFTHWLEQNGQFRFNDSYTGELKLITRQFNAMANEVETNRQRSLYLEKIASWQIIARKLAHEIKNPLTPIQMMVSQLKRRYKGDDPDFRKILDEAQLIITEEVAGLRRMVDNFSQFARLPQPERSVQDLVPLCQHVLELQRPVYEQHTFGFHSAFTSMPCLVDEDLLRQVLINLIKNAAEACGAGPATIGIDLSADAETVLVQVRDDGPGIPAELTSRIFEAYFTTKHTGPNPGMGLGLAVCQKIIIDHGGRLSVRSKPGETVFTIRLPRRTNEPT